MVRGSLQQLRGVERDLKPFSVGRSEIENLEIDLLLEAIFQRYGFDFRSYARASIERRIRLFLNDNNRKYISELIAEVIHDEDLFLNLARYFSISVTEMFRDPHVYVKIREEVLPVLKTWPFFKVWHAGCATGEEAYSMAILLAEEGLLDRATIYGTDFNDESIIQAKNGIFHIHKMKEAAENYLKAGCKKTLSKYFHAKYDGVVMNRELKQRMVFANHNLVTDQDFGEMHMVVCRNVLIYFNRELQNRVLELFYSSLVNGGILCLGSKETIEFTSVEDRFEEIDRKARIFRKRVLV